MIDKKLIKNMINGIDLIINSNQQVRPRKIGMSYFFSSGSKKNLQDSCVLLKKFKNERLNDNTGTEIDLSIFLEFFFRLKELSYYNAFDYSSDKPNKISLTFYLSSKIDEVLTMFKDSVLNEKTVDEIQQISSTIHNFETMNQSIAVLDPSAKAQIMHNFKTAFDKTINAYCESKGIVLSSLEEAKSDFTFSPLSLALNK